MLSPAATLGLDNSSNSTNPFNPTVYFFEAKFSRGSRSSHSYGVSGPGYEQRIRQNLMIVSLLWPSDLSPLRKGCKLSTLKTLAFRVFISVCRTLRGLLVVSGPWTSITAVRRYATWKQLLRELRRIVILDHHNITYF